MTTVMKLTLVVDAVELVTQLATSGKIKTMYLKSFDLDAHDGLGAIEMTDDFTQAYKFKDLAEAMETWRTPSKVRPLRDDGQPNRPLTAFSAEFEEIVEF